MMHAVLIANRFLAIPRAAQLAAAADAHVGTILSNLAYFGFVPSSEVLAALRALSAAELTAFWMDVEPAFKSLTGEDRDMGKFVVYQNFPAEVLKMSEAHYWLTQICLYLGVPKGLVADNPVERPTLLESLKLKSLALADENTAANLYAALTRSTARWTADQLAHAMLLNRAQAVMLVDVDAFGFKENGLRLIAETIGDDREIAISTATDVLRLAAALSGGDVSLRNPVLFASWPGSYRRLLLALLDGQRNLKDDMALRPALWKQLLRGLHPGDYPFMNVRAAYDALYKKELRTFNAEVERLLTAGDAAVLTLLAARPGDFVRRLHKLYAVFGMAAVRAFAPLAPALETNQLLKLRNYVATVNGRKKLVFAPSGNWTKAQFADNTKVPFTEEALVELDTTLASVLTVRLAALYPQGVELADDVDHIKLQTNDQELAPYGRGTVFAIPDEVRFIRSASFWKAKATSNVWFDNGWNFFAEDWTTLGACCWNTQHTESNMAGAVFSGDPTNKSELEGRACQMIDLNIEPLLAAGVRYAVWNVLAYSKMTFSQADDVLATLQWGADPEEGALYEPARAQMVFPLKGENLTKYVAYLDLVERKLVYLDANLYGNVSSAETNGPMLAERMPAMVEYLASLPSVADYFATAPLGTKVVTSADCLTGQVGA